MAISGWQCCWLSLLITIALPSSAAERSAAAIYQFKKQTGYPDGRPGYVVDHIIPLCAGGPDTPENMQWQSIEDAKKKDRLERSECRSKRAKR